MKKNVFVLIFILWFLGTAQTKTELQKHYEDFYKEMRVQGDVSGVINALTLECNFTFKRAQRYVGLYIR